MAFQPRVFEQILADMVAYVRANTQLTDFTVGSVIRTILEAASLEDDEQYHQMVQLLGTFSFSTATGADLDERAADFNLTRLQAASASGTIRFQNGALTTDALEFDTTAGATALPLSDSTEFPVSGFPITVRIGEGTAQIEDVSVTANNILTNVLTCAATTNSHSAGDRVSEVAGSQQDVPSGIQVQVPAQSDNQPIAFQTVEVGTVAQGDFQSNLVTVIATQGGLFGNVGVGQISEFAGGAPFTGALVTNPSSTGGGRDLEGDREFRDRIKLRIQALSRGTPRAVEGGLVGLEDPATGKRIVTAKLVEDFTDEEHLIFIDDGTGFVPDTVILATSTLAAGVAVSATSIQLTDASDFPASGTVLILSSTGSDVSEVLSYESKTGNTLTLETPSVALQTHSGGDSVLLVDDLGIAEEGQNFFQASNFPIRRNTYGVYDDSSGALELRTEGTDYFFNRTSGELQYFGSGLPAGTRVVITYTYFTGLFALAQNTVNGLPQDPVAFPGLAAAGVILYVDTPVIRTISVLLSISVRSGVDESEARDDVALVVENYIDGRTIGQDIILAAIVDRAMGIDGVENVLIQQPTSDVTILENELPKSFDSNGTSLITVL
jgi:uncharacterized phage protein gp47/JayE